MEEGESILQQMGVRRFAGQFYDTWGGCWSVRPRVGPVANECLRVLR